MMKKVWLILLAVVLVFGLVFVGCGGGKDEEETPEDPGTLEETTVFDMATDAGIQALPEGALNITAANEIKPLVQAGEGATHITFEIVKSAAGTKAIKFTTVATWGAGIDLRYAAFGLREGDKITITGEKIAGTRVQVNGSVGAENATIGGVDTRKTENGPFTMEFTLAAADVSALKAGDPAGLRIEGRTSGVTARIDNITIVGKRPSTTTALTAPTLALTGSKVTWAAVAADGVGGYKVTVLKSDESKVDETTINGLEYNLADDTKFATDTYTITVVALGVAGQTTDSPAATIKVRKTVAPETPTNVNVSGVAKIGAGTLSDQSTTSYTYEVTGDNYGGSYAYFTYTPTTNNKLSDFLKVKFTITGLSGDIGWKDVALFANDAVFSGGLGGYMGNSETNENPETINFPIVNIRPAVSGTSHKIGNPYNMTTNTAIDVSLEIDPTVAAEFDDATILYLSIFYNSSNTKFKVENVRFIKAEPNSYVKVTE